MSAVGIACVEAGNIGVLCEQWDRRIDGTKAAGAGALNLDRTDMATYLELQQQIKDLQQRAEHLRLSERAEVIGDIRAKIAAYELTPADLGFKNGTAKKTMAGTKVPIRYRDEQGNTWSGRGKFPNWLLAYLKAGRKAEEFLVG